MKKYRFLGKGLAGLLLGSVALASCNDDDALLQRGETSPLNITVSTDKPASRAVITDEYLPDKAEIGVSLYNADGGSYDSQGYTNIKFTAAGTGASQVWSAGNNTPTLSGNPATVVAYYPWQDVADLSFVPVETATQTDYMYSKPLTGIVNTSPDADITLYHALTAVRVKLVLGDYTGSVDVSNVSVASPALGTAAMLDVYGAEGALTNVQGQGDAVALDVDFDLTAEGTSTDIMLVPDASVTTGTTTLAVTVGGKKFNAGIDFDTEYLQGYVYTYTLTLDNTGMKVTKIAVTQWQEGTNEEEELQALSSNSYVIKIVASYEYRAEVNSLIEENEITDLQIKTAASRGAGDMFFFGHNIKGFVGTIDWGDGTTTTYDVATDWPSHEYPNDGKQYIVTATGTMTGLENKYSTSYSFGQCLKEVKYIGKDCGITSMEHAFANCENLTNISKGVFDNCTEVTSFEETFSHCANLTSIPEELFKNCKKVESFRETFRGTGIKILPANTFCSEVEDIDFLQVLYDVELDFIESYAFNCPNVTKWQSDVLSGAYIYKLDEYAFNFPKIELYNDCFIGCTGLTEIPANTFVSTKENINIELTDNKQDVQAFTTIKSGAFNLPNIISFNNRRAFEGCTSLKTIEAGAFNCPKIKDFNHTFLNCKNLVNVSKDAFKDCPEVTDFGGAFYGCSSLMEIPAGLFDNCTKVTSFDRTFRYCTALQAIPEGLFDHCTEVTSFASTFDGCTELESIPVGLFDKCPEVTAFSITFRGCTNLQSIPEGLFDNCSNVTSFDWTFKGCTSLQSIPTGLFDKCTEVTDFDYTFEGCTGLTGESPYTLIDGVKVHLYERSNYPEYFTAPGKKYDCFLNCTGLTDYANIPVDWK